MKILFVTLPVALFALALSLSAQTVQTNQFEVEPGAKLVVDVDRGNVRVTTWDQTKVETIVTRKLEGGDDTDLAKALSGHRLKVGLEDGDVHVEARGPKSGWLSWFGSDPRLNVRYDITVPRRFNVSLKTAGGRVEVSALQGKVEAHTAGGDLDFKNIQGPVTAKTAGGGITVAGCTDAVQADTSGGNVEIQDYSGPTVNASTAGGSISVDITRQPKSDCVLSTGGGDITVKLPGSAAVNLDAATSGGSVNSRFPIPDEADQSRQTRRGAINGGGPALKLRTSGGNIQVLKR